MEGRKTEDLWFSLSMHILHYQLGFTFDHPFQRLFGCYATCATQITVYMRLWCCFNENYLGFFTNNCCSQEFFFFLIFFSYSQSLVLLLVYSKVVWKCFLIWWNIFHILFQKLQMIYYFRGQLVVWKMQTHFTKTISLISFKVIKLTWALVHMDKEANRSNKQVE